MADISKLRIKGTNLEIADAKSRSGVSELNSIRKSHRNDPANKGYMPYDDAIVTLYDDDGTMKFYDEHVPIYRAHGINPSFAVVACRAITPVGITTSGDPYEAMDWPKIHELVAEGFDMQSHTWSHSRNVFYPYISYPETAQEIEEEYRKADEAFAAQGLDYCCMTFPFGAHTEQHLSIAKKYARYGVNCRGTDGMNYGTEDPMDLNRLAVTDNFSNKASVFNAIDNAIANKAWLIIMTHAGGDQPHAAGLEELLIYLGTKGVKVATFSEAVRMKAPSYYAGNGNKAFRVMPDGRMSATLTDDSIRSLINRAYELGCIDKDAPTPTLSFTVQPESVEKIMGEISGALVCEAAATDGSAVSYQWYKQQSASYTNLLPLLKNFDTSSEAKATYIEDGDYSGHWTAASESDERRCILTECAGKTFAIGCEDFHADDGLAWLYVRSYNAENVKTDLVSIKNTAGKQRQEFTVPDDCVSLYVYFRHEYADTGLDGVFVAPTSMTVSGAFLYDTQEASSQSNGSEAIEGATNPSFEIPTDLAVGEHSYYCKATSETLGSVDSEIAVVKVNDVSYVAKYTLTGAAGQVAPATILDESGNGNDITVLGSPTYHTDGTLRFDAAGEGLYLPAISALPSKYKLHIAWTKTASLIHRLMVIPVHDLNLYLGEVALSVDGTYNEFVQIESSSAECGYTPDLNGKLLVMSKVNVPTKLAYPASFSMDIFVDGDTVTSLMNMAMGASQTAYSGIEKTDTITGFTAALAQGCYLGNRASGDRFLQGSITEFLIEKQ